MIDAAGIAAVLPHRAPMLLVDEVTGLADGEWLTSRRAVGADEPWFAVAGADPTDPDAAFPQPLTLESWAQSAGILATKDSPNPDVLAGSVMLFGGASAVEYHRPVRPGDVLEHRVRFSRVMADSVVAFMIYELHRSRLHMLNFAVTRSHRRLGIGTHMLDKLIGKLTPDRRGRIVLEVRETNLPAQLFFRSLGFRATSVLKDFYRDSTEDAYLMQYVLEAATESMPRRLAG